MSRITPSERPDLSIVAPVYRNAETLEALVCRICDALEPVEISFDIVFINDASPDHSQEVLLRLAQQHASIEIVTLNKNAGQNRAVLTGLQHARGRFVLIMDADLQDPPEAIPSLLAATLTIGCDAVFAGREGKYESPMRRLTSYVFKTGLHIACGIPKDAGLFVLMSRNMVQRLLALETRNPYIVAMIACAGLSITSIPVQRAPRTTGASSYSFWKRLKVGWHAWRWVLAWRCGRVKYIPESPAI